MKEYIDQKEAISAIREYRGYFQDQKSTDMMMLKMEAENILKDLETFDVVPVVHGRNITESHPSDEFICSVCGFVCRDITRSVYDSDTDDWTDYEYTPKYCPDCGAKMIEYVHNWSGGKDSTASIILDYLHNNPPLAKKVIYSEVMFDNERRISAELPEHAEWMDKVAIPQLSKWGFEVVRVRADTDYISEFFRIVTKSKHPERNGKFRGFPLGGMCVINSQVKIKAIRKAEKIAGEAIHILGIAKDEPKRLERMRNYHNQISLLEKFGYTEQMAENLCIQFGMLSPIYQKRSRGGCWFCPNAGISEFADLKERYPELWAELEALAKVKGTISPGFKWGEPFEQVDKRVDDYLMAKWMEENQLKFEV